jgi:LmbE family N-acetylglucosaminyl deacetylase
LIIGAEPRWLTYGAEPYERRATPEQIWSAVVAASNGADCVLLPGYPLSQPDHAELSELLLRKGLECPQVGLYAEQPYQFWQRNTPLASTTATALQHLIDSPLAWSRVATEPAHRHVKLRAVRAYRTQLRHLGLGFFGLRRMIWHEAAQGGEAIAWLSGEAASNTNG